VNVPGRELPSLNRERRTKIGLVMAVASGRLIDQNGAVTLSPLASATIQESRGGTGMRTRRFFECGASPSARPSSATVAAIVPFTTSSSRRGVTHDGWRTSTSASSSRSGVSSVSPMPLPAIVMVASMPRLTLTRPSRKALQAASTSIAAGSLAALGT